MRELYLAGCDLDDAGAAPIFANGVHLRLLELGGNRLTTVPASVRGMARLEELYLYNNKLVSVDAGILALEGTLRELNLFGNDDTMLQPPAPFARRYNDAERSLRSSASSARRTRTWCATSCWPRSTPRARWTARSPSST